MTTSDHREHAEQRDADRPRRVLVRHSGSATDTELAAELLAHLRPLERFTGVDIWTDARLRAGDHARRENEHAIENADVALLLLSADFLGSDVLQDVERPKLLERHRSGDLRVVPILLRSCTWELHPWLAELRPLPEDRTPINSLEGGERDMMLTRLVREIANIATSKRLAGSSLVHKTDSEVSTEQPAALPPATATTTYNINITGTTLGAISLGDRSNANGTVRLVAGALDAPTEARLGDDGRASVQAQEHRGVGPPRRPRLFKMAVAFTLLGLAGLAAAAFTRFRAPREIYRGQVFQRDTGAVVPGADVRLAGTGCVATTDAVGYFEIACSRLTDISLQRRGVLVQPRNSNSSCEGGILWPPPRATVIVLRMDKGRCVAQSKPAYFDTRTDRGTDSDEDGLPDVMDNCRSIPNPDQGDDDEDGIGDACDNCRSIPNPDQSDADNNRTGDVCEDDDKDGLPNTQEVKLGTNPTSKDSDGDGIDDNIEVCPDPPRLCNFNTLSEVVNTDGDALIDALDEDSDNDGVLDKDESVLSGGVPKDSNADGVPDFRDPKWPPR